MSLLNHKKENGWKSTDCCEPAICVVSKRDISLHNIQRNIWKIQDGGCWHVRFVAFVTILLNRPHRSRRFIYFKALFSCKKHQGKIYKTQRVLVANLATNFWILVASTIILVALATVLGAISCPESECDFCFPAWQFCTVWMTSHKRPIAIFFITDYTLTTRLSSQNMLLGRM